MTRESSAAESREGVLKTLRSEEKRGRWGTRTERKCGRREEVQRVKKKK